MWYENRKCRRDKGVHVRGLLVLVCPNIFPHVQTFMTPVLMELFELACARVPGSAGIFGEYFPARADVHDPSVDGVIRAEHELGTRSNSYLALLCQVTRVPAPVLVEIDTAIDIGIGGYFTTFFFS